MKQISVTPEAHAALTSKKAELIMETGYVKTFSQLIVEAMQK